jgi:hypothetical protein
MNTNMSKTLIPSKDIYLKNEKGIETWRFSIHIDGHLAPITDIYIELNRNTLWELTFLAKYCKLKKYSKLKKQELIELIYDNIIFEAQIN